MKFFADTANINEIIRANEWGIIDGVTTNPTLAAREKRPYKEILEEIADVVDGPISAEVVAQDVEGMIEEAKELVDIDENIVIKVPFGKKGLVVTTRLVELGIDVNMTLVFSPNQALLTAKAGARFVSPFVGRIDDIGHSGMEVVASIVQIYSNYDFLTEVLVASVRNPTHVYEAAMIGADIATVPFKVLDKMFNHPLTDTGIQRFLDDWNAAGLTF